MNELLDFLYRIASLAIPLSIYAVHLERRLTRMETKIENLADCQIANCPFLFTEPARKKERNCHE